MRALDLMTAPVKVVSGHDPVTRAARILEAWEVGLLPVVFDDAPFRLQGVITRRDIQTRCTRQGHRAGCRVADHMTRAPLVTVGPEASVDEVLDRMETSHLRLPRRPITMSPGRGATARTKESRPARLRARTTTERRLNSQIVDPWPRPRPLRPGSPRIPRLPSSLVIAAAGMAKLQQGPCRMQCRSPIAGI